jgi:hypothetical protein
VSSLRYLTDDDEVRVVPTLKNGRPAHLLSREERARGGRVRAAKARERKESLRNDPRGRRVIPSGGSGGSQASRRSSSVPSLFDASSPKRKTRPLSLPLFGARRLLAQPGSG